MRLLHTKKSCNGAKDSGERTWPLLQRPGPGGKLATEKAEAALEERSASTTGEPQRSNKI